MSYHKQQPTVETLTGPMEGQRYRHPAFGEISVTKGQGQGMELFGSSLNHRSAITVTISTAHLDRHLNRDWIHSDRQVASFHMSEAQWASLISSQGGGGTPITFESRPIDSAELQLCPGIESIETMRETFHRELKEKCEHYMAQAIELAEALSLAAADGKAGKGRLVELQKMASELAIGLPNTISFIQKQTETAMENTVAAGKIEIESFVTDLATRTGFEALREQPVTLIDDRSQDEKTLIEP
jgi:hypothetical protein